MAAVVVYGGCGGMWRRWCHMVVALVGRCDDGE